MNDISPTSLDADTRDECLRLIDLALAEDLGSADTPNQLDCTTTALVPQNVSGHARFVSRQSGVICGVAVCQLIVDRVDRELRLDAMVTDGSVVSAGHPIAEIHGNAQDILVVERTCLNFLGRLSGVATLTAEFVKQTNGTSAKLFDTRKTTPGWRRLEKYAVRCGGGENHRMGLYDAILIKDNHLAMLARIDGSDPIDVSAAVDRARKWIDQNDKRLVLGRETILQIEVDHLEQLESALAHGPDIVLLDNMTNEQLSQAVTMRDESAPQIQLEASGGVDLKTVGAIAKTGIDRISVGALTHSAVNFDVGLDWVAG